MAHIEELNKKTEDSTIMTVKEVKEVLTLLLLPGTLRAQLRALARKTY